MICVLTASCFVGKVALKIDSCRQCSSHVKNNKGNTFMFQFSQTLRKAVQLEKYVCWSTLAVVLY